MHSYGHNWPCPCVGSWQRDRVIVAAPAPGSMGIVWASHLLRPSSAGHKAQRQKISLSNHQPLIYVDIIQSYFRRPHLSLLSLLCSGICLNFGGPGRSLNVGELVLWGKAERLQSKWLLPQLKIILMGTEVNRASLEHRAAVHRAGVPAPKYCYFIIYIVCQHVKTGTAGDCLFVTHLCINWDSSLLWSQMKPTSLGTCIWLCIITLTKGHAKTC